MLSEFGLIKDFFSDKSGKNKYTRLGIGDDAAIVSVPSACDFVIAVDTLVSGVHFPKQTSPRDIAYKALAVNLSDLAAMGAEPVSFTLALTLSEKEQNSQWLESFSSGLFDLANKIPIELIGGDTTQGPLSITIQAHGLLPINKSLRRSGAKPGDRVFVTGTLGDASLGLKYLQSHFVNSSCLLTEEKQYLLDRLNRPQAKLKAGRLLRDLASSCIDVSDGLLADLGHICEASQCRAAINAGAIPLSTIYKKHFEHSKQDKIRQGLIEAVTGGDDYELCLTIKPDNIPQLEKLELECQLSEIGEILSEDKSATSINKEKVVMLDQSGEIIPINSFGYTHFKN